MEPATSPASRRELWIVAGVASGIAGVGLALLVLGLEVPQIIGTPLGVLYVGFFLFYGYSVMKAGQYWEFVLAYCLTGFPWLVLVAALDGSLG